MSFTQPHALFKPFRLKSLEIKNRIVMAPMTRSRSPEGIPNEEVAAYYQRRAQGEVGLILSEGTVIDRPASRNESGIPFFHGEAALNGWQRVVDDVHRAGGKMGAQIWHAGASPGLDGTYRLRATQESPSGLVAAGKAVGVPMNDEAIADSIAAFARAAAEAKRLGFDVVEIHGAHGYLIDQFFWAATNLRTDQYGGPSLRERTRFAADVLRAVRAALGPDFPVILRVSQWKVQDFSARPVESPDAMAEWLTPLVDAGADMLHCSQRRFWEPEFPEVDGEQGLNFAGWAKKLTGVPTITVGSVGLDADLDSMYLGDGVAKPSGLDNLERRLARGEFDLVAVGRALIADPQWPAKIRRGDVAQLQGFSPAALAELA